jgi:hypothetical protein
MISEGEKGVGERHVTRPRARPCLVPMDPLSGAASVESAPARLLRASWGRPAGGQGTARDCSHGGAGAELVFIHPTPGCATVHAPARGFDRLNHLGP